MAVMPPEEPSGTSAEICADGIFRDGYALLGRVITEEGVANLNEEFNRRFAHLILPGAQFEDSLKTGDRRYMLTVELSGAFSDLAVFASPPILNVLNIVFGQDYVLESFGVVLSLPGAEAQHTHSDGTGLYSPTLDSILPPYAVTVGIPLIDMNSKQGTTEVFPGSHRQKESRSAVGPDVPAGSAIIWDFRTLHRGTENQSERYRPLLYMTYSKPWWRDVDNFKPVWSGSAPPTSQRRLLLAKDFFESLPREIRFLFRNVDELR